jgi:serine/threonine-protein kinase
MASLGSYRVQGTLGRGGEGSVLLALDTRLRRYVALKRHRLPPARSARRHVLREARRYAAMDDPRITRVHDLVDDGEELLLVLQYVHGCDLELALTRHRLSLASALSLASDIAAGLAAAHRRHIIHGDLKAGNVLIGEDGRALLTDFGVAVAAADGQARGVSPSALTPEHLRGDGLEPRSDLFALGRLLYRMLLGFDPFPGNTAPERLLSASFRPVTGGAGISVPPALATLVEALLAPAPGKRPASALVVCRELRAIARALPAPAPRPVTTDLAASLRRPPPADAAALLPISLEAASRRRRLRMALVARLRRPAVLAAGSALVLVLAGGAGWRLAAGPPCVALAVPRLVVAPGTDLRAGISQDWLQAQFAAALRARRPLQLTGDRVPGSRLRLTREGTQYACVPEEHLSLTLECRPTLCLLSLGAQSVALFPEAPLARWSLALERLADSRYP